MKHRIDHTLQKYRLNPPIKLALAVGLPLPGYALLETRGRKTGKPRRTPVGDGERIPTSCHALPLARTGFRCATLNVIGVYDLSCVRDLGLDGKQALSKEEVPIELEQVDSTDPPLAVHGLHVGRYRQHRRHSTEEVHEFDWTLSGDPARVTVFHRSVPICAAVCRQMAQQADRLTKHLESRRLAVPSLRRFLPAMLEPVQSPIP
jgi:hypothetical protein